MFKIALLISLTAVFSLAGSKDRDWQTGKVLDSNFNPYFAARNLIPESKAIATTPFSTGNPAPNSMTEQAHDDYVIETDVAAYLVQRTRLKISGSPNVKKYAKIRFAVEKGRLILVDEDGKEYSTKILEQKPRAYDAKASTN